MSKRLGPYLVPLHLNGTLIQAEFNLSESDLASLRYQHWISMMQRSKGRGFRLDRGTGSKRRRPHNSRRNKQEIAGDVAMILNGFRLIARHGNTQAKPLVQHV